MKFNIFLIAFLTTCTGCVTAEPVSWKERGSTVSAAINSATKVQADGVAAKSANTEKPTITLPTGQVATLTGGVYVKSKDTASVLVWAIENGYTATKDKYASDVVHIESTPGDSIAIANKVAAIEGVTTAAPNYRVPKVAK